MQAPSETTSPVPLAVCSWSLRAETPERLVEHVRACGFSAVQLALTPMTEERASPERWANTLREAGITIVSGMLSFPGEDYTSISSIARTGGVMPDDDWSSNLALASQVAEVASDLGLPLVTAHAGFMPRGDDPRRDVAFDRIERLAGVFASRRVRLGLETGQESAADLHDALEDPRLAGVGVNFDPANMLLYGSGDPINSFKVLAPKVVQVHLKDAVPSGVPGKWGEEVPMGDGRIDWEAFSRVMRDRVPPGVGVVIEREAGEDRVGDISRARELARLLGLGS